jgi:hypothetical protein
MVSDVTAGLLAIPAPRFPGKPDHQDVPRRSSPRHRIRYERTASEAAEAVPSMNAVTTMVTDSILTPNMRNSVRCQVS